MIVLLRYSILIASAATAVTAAAPPQDTIVIHAGQLLAVPCVAA